MEQIEFDKIKYIPRELPIDIKSCSLNYIEIESKDVDNIMCQIEKMITNFSTLQEIKCNPKKGKIEFSFSKFSAVVRAYKSNNKFYIDYNRMSGCAFMSVYVYQKIKILIAEYNKENTQELYKDLETYCKKTCEWYRMDPKDFNHHFY
jgi:hypothetical protein